jgi:hypothetical protein
MLMSDAVVLGDGIYRQGDAASALLSSTCVVQLRYATLPHFLRAIAVHYWFAVFDPASCQWQRWEVWQTKNAGGTSVGYVHCDRRHPDCGVGGGVYRLAAEWHGSAAQAIRAILARIQEYPYCERYRAWPGPNSNTFVAWVLRKAGVHYRLDPRAVGKDYMGLLGMRLSCRPVCAQVETPLLGVRLAVHDGVEVHLLGLTGGLRWSPPAMYTPFGQVGRRNEVVPILRDSGCSVRSSVASPTRSVQQNGKTLTPFCGGRDAPLDHKGV